MDIVVFVKRVPDTKEADLTISPDGRHIVEKDLVFDINDSDRYAVEEAVQLKEKFGGTVTAITLGTTASEDVLRRCLATGVDSAIRLTDNAFADLDGFGVARVLAAAIKDMKYDLVLTGVQASDDLQSMVGPVIADYLGLPHATVVNHLEIQDNRARVHRELEGGIEDIMEIQLPAVLSIQTGINEPRYVSIMGIRKASRLEIKTSGADGLALNRGEIGPEKSAVQIKRLFVPVSTKATEILTGSLDEASEKLAIIIKEKGGLS